MYVSQHAFQVLKTLSLTLFAFGVQKAECGAETLVSLRDLLGGISQESLTSTKTIFGIRPVI